MSENQLGDPNSTKCIRAHSRENQNPTLLSLNVLPWGVMRPIYWFMLHFYSQQESLFLSTTKEGLPGIQKDSTFCTEQNASEPQLEWSIEHNLILWPKINRDLQKL